MLGAAIFANIPLGAANAMDWTAAKTTRRIGWGLACIPLAVFAGVIVLAVSLARLPGPSQDRGTVFLRAAARTDGVPAAQAKAALPITPAGRDRGPSPAAR